MKKIFFLLKNIAKMKNKQITKKFSDISTDVKNFFLNSDLGSTEPLLVNGLQFDQDGNLLQGQLINPNAQPLNEYLKDTMFGQYGIIVGGNLSRLLNIYVFQHNMFKHATVNQGKPPTEWDFNKLGVTDRFLQTFRKYIPAGKEYDINNHLDISGSGYGRFSLTDLLTNIKNDKKSRFPIDYRYNSEKYVEEVARPINDAAEQNNMNLRKFLSINNLPLLQKYVSGEAMESLAGTSLRTQQMGEMQRQRRREMEKITGQKVQGTGLERPINQQRIAGKGGGIRFGEMEQAMQNLNQLYQNLLNLQQMNRDGIDNTSLRTQELGQWYNNTRRYIDQGTPTIAVPPYIGEGFNADFD